MHSPIRFRVQRNGVDIRRFPLRNRGRNPGITYSQSFGQWEAAHAAGLDFWLWDNGHYSQLFKAKVMAWYPLHLAVKNHIRDANAPKKVPKGRRRR